jgi:uncharacterized protein YdeI (YjbR/CyaY-like superfamily)
MKTVEAKDRAEWRAWLAANHDKEREVWLVYYKKETGKASVAYGASVEEALCYGWVDSIIKSLDDTKFARKFTPRKEDSKWSPSNIKRVEKMMGEGLMTEHGLRLVEAAKRTGNWETPTQKPTLTYEMPSAFAEAVSGMDRYGKTTGDKREKDQGIDPIVGKRGKAWAAVRFLYRSDLIDWAWDGRPNPALSLRQPAAPQDFEDTLKFVEYVIGES